MPEREQLGSSRATEWIYVAGCCVDLRGAVARMPLMWSQSAPGLTWWRSQPQRTPHRLVWAPLRLDVFGWMPSWSGPHRYDRDEATVARAGAALAEVLSARPGARVLCHSLGCRVYLTAALLLARKSPAKFSFVALVQPDVEENWMHAALIKTSSLARQIAVFGHPEDAILEVSTTMHEGRARGGQLTDELCAQAKRAPHHLKYVDVSNLEGVQEADNGHGPHWGSRDLILRLFGQRPLEHLRPSRAGCQQIIRSATRKQSP